MGGESKRFFVSLIFVDIEKLFVLQPFYFFYDLDIIFFFFFIAEYKQISRRRRATELSDRVNFKKR